jgi:predicted DNA-binding transcriptional regulator YafY
MQTLEGAGFPIYFDKRKGSYRFTEGYTLRKPNLKVQESLALALARVSLVGMNAGFEEELKGIEEKLAFCRPGLPEHIIITGEQFDADIHDTFLTLNEAIVRKQKVAFTYQAASTRQTTKRTVDPYYLYFSEGIWTLRGYCHTRKGMRAFALDRMSGVEMLEDRYESKPVSPGEEHEGAFGRYVGGEPVLVRLIFSGQAIQAVSRKKWHPSQQSRTLEDGRVELTFKVNGIFGIRPWIYRWLPCVAVVEPKELAELLERELEEGLQSQRNISSQ